MGPNRPSSSRKRSAHYPSPESRDRYRYFLAVATRWMDNDAYGHVNNVVYYSYFDTVVNRFLIEAGALDVEKSPVIGLVVETRCQYFNPIAFPETVRIGLRVGKLGRTSVHYEIGIFRDDEKRASAQGYLVHVYVDRATRRPIPLPRDLHTALQPLISK